MQTEILRVPLTQEANYVLKPLEAHLDRLVQILVPVSGAAVFMGMDVTPEEVGPNRVYKLAPFPPGQTIRFRMSPEQWLIGAVDAGRAAITLIVEYVEAQP
jgi:hypothetical protein